MNRRDFFQRTFGAAVAALTARIPWLGGSFAVSFDWARIPPPVSWLHVDPGQAARNAAWFSERIDQRIYDTLAAAMHEAKDGDVIFIHPPKASETHDT